MVGVQGEIMKNCVRIAGNGIGIVAAGGVVQNTYVTVTVRAGRRE